MVGIVLQKARVVCFPSALCESCISVFKFDLREGLLN